jgi:hypothetical protein
MCGKVGATAGVGAEGYPFPTNSSTLTPYALAIFVTVGM